MQTLTFELTEQNLDACLDMAVSLLKSDELVAVPTETVYGLAANALSDVAVNKIYTAKGRPSNNPLIMHVAKKFGILSELANVGLIRRDLMSNEAQTAAQKLMDLFWPGPLTLVLPSGGNCSPLVTAGLQTVALRMPKHAFFLKLLELLDFPLAAPSANRSMGTSPTSAQHVSHDLDGKVPLIVDAGTCFVGLESTILKINEAGQVKILRYGAITPDTLLKFGFSIVKDSSDSLPEKIEAPGMLALHYAPKAKFFYVENEELLNNDTEFKFDKQSVVIIVLSDKLDSSVEFEKRATQYFFDKAPHKSIKFKKIYLNHGELSVDTVARNLYSSLRDADALNPDAIVMQASEFNEGLWLAIHDRMKRAASK